MSCAVGDVGDEIHILSLFSSEQAIDGVDQHFDYIDVLPLVETADIICFGDVTAMKNEVNGSCVVLYIEPVAYVLSLTIYGKGFAMAYIIDKEGNEFLRELEGP